MKNKNALQRFIFDNLAVRGELVHLEECFQEIMQQHDYPLVIRTILGEMLAAASLLCASVKFKGRLTIQFQGAGKLKLLMAQCTDDNGLRGLAQWREAIQPEELLPLLKQGTLAVIIDPEESAGNRYQGIVAWEGDSLASSLEGYFKYSEQIPTRIWLAVDEERAAGMFIQQMPQANQDTQADQDWEHVSLLTSTITAHELLTLENETLLNRLYAEDDVRLFEPDAVQFRCTCSEKRSENALRLVGQEEINEELREKQKITVTCEFCNKEYDFDKVDIAKIFTEGNKPDGSTQIH